MAPKSDKKRESNQQNNKATKKCEDPEYLEKVDPILMKNIRELTAGRDNLRIFVPMCGKTHDMLWLAEQGHAITGAEINPRYIRAFFRDAELEYELRSEQITTKTKANVYEADGQNITLYQCDIFDLSVEVLSQFDAIWDQSALPVINEMGDERLKDYTSLMQTLLKPDGRHMVEVCKHGANFVDSKMLKSLFGDKSDVRYIGKRIWKYDPQDFAEEECEEEEEESMGNKKHGEHDSNAHEEHESHGCGEHGHDDGHGKTQMFYHLITFKDEVSATSKRKQKIEEPGMKKSKKTPQRHLPKRKCKK